MNKLIAWLTPHWQDGLITVGSLGAYASVWLTLRERRRKDRLALDARLTLETTRSRDGALIVRLAWATTDRAEPLVATVTLRSPAGGLLVYNAHLIDENEPSAPRFGEVLDIPLHSGASSATTSFFVIGSRESPKIESGIATICVVRTASRKCLISTTRTISARA